MKSIILNTLLLVLLACVTSCKLSQENPNSDETLSEEVIGINTGLSEKRFLHNGLPRTYLIYIPTNYDENSPVPLVFNFHGYGSNAIEQFNYSGLETVAQREGFILVMPQGELFQGTSHWNVGGWTIGSTIDDVDFTDALLAYFIEEYSIDEKRIYSTGMSNGGYMSFLLACQLSDKIAAIASVTGSMTPQTHAACNPQRAMPILQIHGDSDRVVPYNGADWTLSIDYVLEYWNTQNNCDLEPEISQFPDIDSQDGSTIFKYDYNGEQVNTTHFKVIGGRHTWPGSMVGNKDISAAEEIWSFFSQYDVNGRRQ
ncbi:prolyl oligopeptidase family serine peptidase [Flavobacteriaceae bacterium]|nr:prolyl oligopeptidase family serine peptidase [Flavobacteriaceae bacterium]